MEKGNVFKLEHANFNLFSFNNFPISLGSSSRASQPNRLRCLSSFNCKMEKGNVFKLEQNAKFNLLSFNNFPISLGSS